MWINFSRVYYQLFVLSFWRHPSLQRIQWWASDVMLNFSKSVLMQKQTHLHLGWPEGEYIFIFGWTIPLRMFCESGSCFVCNFRSAFSVLCATFYDINLEVKVCCNPDWSYVEDPLNHKRSRCTREGVQYVGIIHQTPFQTSKEKSCFPRYVPFKVLIRNSHKDVFRALTQQSVCGAVATSVPLRIRAIFLQRSGT